MINREKITTVLSEAAKSTDVFLRVPKELPWNDVWVLKHWPTTWSVNQNWEQGQHLSPRQPSGPTLQDEQTGMYWLSSMEAANLDTFRFVLQNKMATESMWHLQGQQRKAEAYNLLHNITKQKLRLLESFFMRVQRVQALVSLYDFSGLNSSSLKKMITGGNRVACK